MEVFSNTKYHNYLRKKNSLSHSERFLVNLGYPMLFFGSIGAIAWAVRGSSGWDGIQGTIIPGITWGILWVYLFCLKGIDSRTIALWLGLGIAIGGELGYGQYISWIMGRFGDGKVMPVLQVSSFIGYGWLFICGISWAGIGAVILGWSVKGRVSFKVWIGRIFLSVGLATFGWYLIKNYPYLFFPHFRPEIYGDNNGYVERTIYTNTQNFIVFLWWIGAVLASILQNDKPTKFIGLAIGIGFGIVFSASASWCLGYQFAPGYIDWWKMWELSCGFGLGILYVIAHYWTGKNLEQKPLKDGNFNQTITSISTAKLSKNYKSISFIFSISLLLYILFHGGSFQMGGFLGLYDVNVINQYHWPVQRIYLFIPIASWIIFWGLLKIWQTIRCNQDSKKPNFSTDSFFENIHLLFILITIIGVITIWPEKIGVLYVIFLGIAVFSLNRLHFWYKE
jgi:hypothetical protein